MTALILLLLLPLAAARGPHHPRGESVAKHSHYRPTKADPRPLMGDGRLLHDTQHIEEHLEEAVEAPDLSQMSDAEVEFYYFQVHDADKNGMLDGLEILQALAHTAHEGEGGAEELAYYEELIDKVLVEDDVDGDGYLSYAEYGAGRQKALIEERARQPSVKMLP